MIIKHSIFEIWAESALYTALKVLGIPHMYDMVTLKYTHDDKTHLDAWWKQTVMGNNTIVLNKSIIIPMPISCIVDKDTYLNATDELKKELLITAYILKICFLVYHEARHMYQSITSRTKYYKKADGFLNERKLWADEFRKVDSNPHNVSRVLEDDAEMFAFYMSSRFPYDLGIFDVDKYKRYIEEYSKIDIPDAEELANVIARLDETKRERQKLSWICGLAESSF